MQSCSGSSETSGSVPLSAAQPRLCQASHSEPGLSACAARARHGGTTAADAAGRSAWHSLAARVVNTGLRSGSVGGAGPLVSSTQAGPARYVSARSVDSKRSGRGSLRQSCRPRLCQVTLWALWVPSQAKPSACGCCSEPICAPRLCQALPSEGSDAGGRPQLRSECGRTALAHPVAEL